MDNKNLLLFSSKFAKQKEYWINKLAGEIEETGLLFENRTPDRLLNGSNKTTLDFSIAENGLGAKLLKLSKNTDISLFIILLAALNVLIYRCTGKEDIIVKTPVYQPKISEQTVNNRLFIRNGIHGNKTFKEIILETRESVLKAHANQDYPADKLIEYLNEVSQKPGDNSLSGILCALDGIHDPAHIEELQAKSSIAFLFARDGEREVSRICYAADSCDLDYVKRLPGYFTRLLAGAVDNVHKKIADLPFLPAQEKERIVTEFNDTSGEYHGDKTIARLFREQAVENPDNEAVVEVDSGNSISYGELNTRANRLARLLREKGLRTGGVAAVKAGHSIAAMTAILSILKAGGAYLCVDPDYPELRQKYLLDDSSVDIILSQEESFAGRSESNGNREIVTIGSAALGRGAAEEPETGAGPGHPAYVIYTSGSTGIPKGVIVENRAVVRLVKNTNYIRFGKDIRGLQTGALEFDSSTFEMWGPLLNGGKLYLIKKNDMLMPATLKKAIATYKINLMWMASGLFNKMFDADPALFRGLENILIGGDVLSPPRINELRRRYPGLNVINGFGPTENTTFSTCFLIEEDYENNIPIGKPIANSTAYLLDKNGSLLPVGAAGHLCLGGDGLARGYLNNPELTSEKFIAAPQDLISPHRPGRGDLAVPKESRIYLSGDMARRLPDGAIEFIERLDRQVKIRGFRVETTGIENKLLEIDYIKEVAVTALARHEYPGEDGDAGEKYLCAYFTAGQEVEAADLRSILSSILPDYMVPAYFIQLPEIPLTANGKVDRKALPEPAPQEAGEITPPRDEIEARLVKLWAEVLHIEKNSFGIDGNFFELGGHSLTTINLAAKIQKEFNLELPITEIFKLQTIRALAADMKGRTASKRRHIEAVEKQEYYPLSSAQERMYFLQQMDSGNTAYNNPMVHFITLSSKESVAVVLRKLVKRHESLRTSFCVVDEAPQQRIHKNVEFAVEYFETGGDKKKIHGITAAFVKPFDLSQAPLFRVALINTGGNKNMLLIDLHHIITDGVSLNIILHDFALLHEGKKLWPAKLQYKDYSCWQNSPARKAIVKKQGEYWLKKFTGDIPLLNLPVDFPRVGRGFAGGNITFEIGSEEVESLTALAKSRDATLYMILLAAYTILLAKLCDQAEIIVGTPAGGRSSADLENIAGMFVDTVVMKNIAASDSSFSTFLEEVKTNALEAFDNQDFQFENIVRELKLKRDIHRNPLFDVMFFLQTQYGKVDTVDSGLGLLPDIDLYAGVNTKFDLTLTGIEGKEGLLFLFEYRSELFKKETIEKFVDYFKRIIHEIIRRPGQKIAEIDILPPPDKERLLYDFNCTAMDYPKNRLIPQIFSEQAEKTPDSTALECSGASLSYRYVSDISNKLARTLQKKGVDTDKIVAIMVERSLEMVTGIFGILKAGGAYMPIDPDYPAERKRYMLRDSGAKQLLTAGVQGKNLEQSPNPEYEILFIEKLSNGPGAEFVPPHNSAPLHPMSPSSLAYVIYTSGSTGKPKGVMVEHSAVVNLLSYLYERYPFNKTDRYLLKTNYVFDVSVSELFGWFMGGGRAVVLEKDAEKSPYIMLAEIWKKGVTFINFVPSMFSVFVDVLQAGDISKLSSLKYIFLAGEALKPSLVEAFRAFNLKIVMANQFGPTEGTVYCSEYPLSQQDGASNMLIGKPLKNVRLYILDRNNSLVGAGITGELCIAGTGLARGYLSNPLLTKEKFISNPYVKNDRLYKTGDLTRWLSDGNIEFLGRIDDQVKLRGFRVELAEIENRLIRHEEIQAAVVLAKEDKLGEKYICAYILTGAGLPAAGLRAYLKRSLPDYMVPAYFVNLAKFPLNPNGKIDKKALPEPVLKTGEYFTAPENETEKKLAAIWSEVLRIDPDKIGVETDFFDFGGHSLRAINLIEKIHKKMNVRVPLDKIFTLPTVRGLAKYIEAAVQEEYVPIYPAEKRQFYALSSAQRRLYFLQRLDPGGTVYNNLHIHFLKSPISKDKLAEIFNELIKRNEILRTSYRMVNENPVQIVHGCDDLSFTLEDYRSEAAGIKKIIRGFIRPFNLEQAPLLRAGLVEMAGQRPLFLVDIHHIAEDGTSFNLIAETLTALTAGQKPAPLKVQYKDYVLWQTGEKRVKLHMKQEAYWLNRFAGDPPALELPYDYSRPVMQSFAGDKAGFEIGRGQAEALKETAGQQDATLYMILLAIYTILLAKLSGQEDIVVGSPTAGRRHVDLENIVGMFVNSILLRNRPNREKKFSEFLEEIKENTLAAFDNQEYPFEELVEKIKVTRDTGRNPIFDVMFILQNQVEDIATAGSYGEKTGAASGMSGSINPVSRFDMTLSGMEIEGRLSFVFEYCTKLFKKETIERFIGYFKNIVSSILEMPTARLQDIEFMNEAEKKRILDEYNKTRMEFPEDKVIHQLFEEQVLRTPHHTALVYEGSHLSFKQLDERANGLAGILHAKGVKQDIPAGIMVERSLEMLIGIFAVLKSGGVYLPIEPYFPAERKHYMLSDSGAGLLLTTHDVFEDFQTPGSMEIEPLFIEKTSINEKKAEAESLAGKPAYIIYTSGSTGNPKGVIVEHKAILNTLFALNRRYPFAASDAYLLKTSYMFDVSVAELFGWIFNEEGGKLVILEKNGEKDPLKITNAIEKYFITHINFVPSMLNILLDYLDAGSPARLLSLKYIFTAGEAFIPGSAEKFERYFNLTPGTEDIRSGSECRLENIYGPTEAAVYGSRYSLSGWQGGGSVPIGSPLYNVKLYILDKHASPLPIGVTGELYIAGKGLARGYVNNPELTGEKFVTICHSRLPDRLYRTGDLTRWLPGGDVEFCGRIDSQVKIRGFRIELGEIESRLLNHEKINEVVVTAQADKQGEKYLCAYIKEEQSHEIPGDRELREYLSGSLPEYMIPSYFVGIDRIPLTPGGKIDKKALPEPGVNTGSAYIGPGNEIEGKLVEIWSQVLNLEKGQIGINFDFFDLGGHSLKAVVLISKIQKEFNIRLPLDKIFKLRNIFRLAKCIASRSREHKYTYQSIKQAEKREYYELSSAQERMYILQHKNKGGVGFNLPTVYLIEAKVDKEKLDAAFTKLIARHEVLRTSYEMLNTRPVQRIHEHVNFVCDYFQVKNREGAEEIVRNYVRPFVFTEVPLIRAALVNLAAEQNLLIVDIHHINIDFVSVDIFISDLSNLYSGKYLPGLPLQYRDFAGWQNNLLKSGKIKEQEEYWLKRFAEKPPLLDIPTDYLRPKFQSFAGAGIQFTLTRKETTALKKYGESQGVTLYILLSAVLNVLLAKLSGQEDIVIGSPTAGRRDDNLQNLVGMFVNTLALRNFPGKDKTFKNFVEEVKESTLKALENQDYQIEELITKIEWDRDISRNVLFDVVLNVLDLERGESRTPALDVKPYDFDLKIARFDLYFHVQENGGMLRFNVDYSTKLFEKSTVELYIKYFKDIIFAVLQNPGKKLGEIEIIDEKIKEEVLADFNVEFEDEL